MGSPALVAERAKALSGRRIPSLDGLRAVSIVLVVLSHTKSLLPAGMVRCGLFRYLVGGGLHGVQVFFVISGYLITTLLLREVENTGNISLRRFYLRRILRIFPPFYAYLVVVAVLWMAGHGREDVKTFFAAATYTIVYLRHPQGWLLQHAWSLSIEEQFYLVWPAVLLFAHRRAVVVRLAIGLMIMLPIIRAMIILRGNAEAGGYDRLIVNFSSIDMLMVGGLLAMLQNRKEWREWCARWMPGWFVAGFAVLGLLLVPYANAKLAATWGGEVTGAFGYSVTALAIGAGLEYLVRRPESIAGRLLNLYLMRHIGVISYSIYLWQQFFTAREARLGLLTYPLVLLAAEISFWLIEKPAMQARARLAL